MSPAVKAMLWIFLAITGTVIAGVAWGGWMMWKRPLTLDAHFSRIALSKTGLSKAHVETTSGRMSVWEGGSGPVMVLLHGAGDQAGAWARVVPSLVGTYRVIIPDLPGHWKSDPRTGPIRVPQVLDGVASLMDACCAGEQAILVGNSMGAWMAMLYAKDNPGRVSRVVAVNGGAIANDTASVNLFPTTRDAAHTTMESLLGPNTKVPPGFVLDDVVRRARSGPAARFAQTASEMGEWVLDGRLREVDVPVELVWGAADGMMTVGYARRMLEELPRARLTPIEDCGHLPQRECPAAFLDALSHALDQPPVDSDLRENRSPRSDVE